MKSKKGISLIVLVITIIVMIILAVAIILSLSNSGIISKANKAKTDNDVSNAKELVEVAHSEWLLMTADEQTENGGSFVSYVTDKLEKSGYDPDKYILSEEGGIEVCVAKIGDTKYATLKAAIDSIAENNSADIVIINDFELKESGSISANTVVSIDLNGCTISSQGDAIYNYGTLVLKDTSSSKTGKIIAIPDESKYDEKYDVNKDGYVGQWEVDEFKKYFGQRINENSSEEAKKFDFDGNGAINSRDVKFLKQHYSVAYAVVNSSDTAVVTVENINKNNLQGKPSGIYVKGTVTGY